MKFRMFTDVVRNRKVAVHVDKVAYIEVGDKTANTTMIWLDAIQEDRALEVAEDFDTVFSRLNTIAE